MKKETYNDVIYSISQAGLNKITDSVVSISFSIENEKVNVLAYILDGASSVEKRILLDFQTAVENRLSAFTVNFELKEISIKQFQACTYKTLKYVMFLRNEESI